MTMIESFLQSAYGKFAAFAGIAATFWGFAKAVGALKRWIIARGVERRTKENLPKETYHLIQKLREEMDKHNAEHKEQLSEIKQKVEALVEKQAFTEEQIATVQNEKLCWAYIHYGKEHHPITMATKTSFERMYEQYKNNGKRNHVPSDW